MGPLGKWATAGWYGMARRSGFSRHAAGPPTRPNAEQKRIQHFPQSTEAVTVYLVHQQAKRRMPVSRFACAHRGHRGSLEDHLKWPSWSSGAVAGWQLAQATRENLEAVTANVLDSAHIVCSPSVRSVCLFGRPQVFQPAERRRCEVWSLIVWLPSAGHGPLQKRRTTDRRRHIGRPCRYHAVGTRCSVEGPPRSRSSGAAQAECRVEA